MCEDCDHGEITVAFFILSSRVSLHLCKSVQKYKSSRFRSLFKNTLVLVLLVKAVMYHETHFVPVMGCKLYLLYTMAVVPQLCGEPN